MYIDGQCRETGAFRGEWGKLGLLGWPFETGALCAYSWRPASMSKYCSNCFDLAMYLSVCGMLTLLLRSLDRDVAAFLF